MAKTAKELLEMRIEDFETIRRAQMRIALIDAKLTNDPRYREDIDNMDPEFLATLMPVAALEKNPTAPLN